MIADLGFKMSAWRELSMRNRFSRFSAVVVVAAAALLSPPLMSDLTAQGRLQSPTLEAECRLKYIRKTKSEVARSYIIKSCNFLSLGTAGSVLSRDERVFHDCVLEVMSGTEDDRNAVQLANACRERAWSK